MSSATIKIPAELFALAESSRFEGEIDLPQLTAGPDEYRFDQALSWVVDVTNTGGAFFVSGKVTGTGTCACSRCLEDVTRDFDGDIEAYLLIDGFDAHDMADDSDDLGEDDFDTLPADHVVDLTPYIAAALMVDAPDMPLCTPDCAGLCPQCGANLNEGDCGCGQDEALAAFEREANPFSVLADLSFD